MDRPGFGGSSSRPGRRLEDAPGDALALADHLGIDRFAIVGYSSGAPNAVATAAAAGDRATALALVAGVTDLEWEPAWAGYVRPAEVELLRLENAAEAVAWCEAHYGADGSGLFAEMSDLGAPDTEALTDEAFVVGLMGTMAEAFRQGVIGYAEDTVAEGKPWRFDPGAVTARTSVHHGEQDRIVPIEHGRHNAQLIPGASFTAWPQHGHLSVRREVPAIVAELIRQV